MSTKGLISIIMPVYNAQRFLRITLRDILKQTYENWELVCINDGSGDHSYNILEYYASLDKRIKLFTQNNMGAGESRNRGIDLAKGEYLFFADADDRFFPDLLEKAYYSAQKGKADIVLFDGLSFDSETGYITDPTMLNNAVSLPDDTVFPGALKDELFQSSSPCVWNKLYRSDFIKDNGIRFQDLPYMNDIAFVIQSMADAERILYLKEVLVFYRRGIAGSVSSKANKKRNIKTAFDALLESVKRIDDIVASYDLKISYAKFALSMIYAQITEQLNEKNYIEYCRLLDWSLAEKLYISELSRQDFEDDIFYEDMSVWRDNGPETFIIRVISRHETYLADRLYGIVINRETIQSERSLLFISGVPDGSKIAIYGAGKIGRRLIDLNERVRKYNIIAWFDGNPAQDVGYSIEPQLFDPGLAEKADFLVIAVEDYGMAMEIKVLLKDSIDDDKVIW